MGDWVSEYTCGTCTYYEYAGQYEKGYCSYYKTYYHHDDTCNHYEKKESYSSGSTGCFLTTACCEYKRLPDDCEILTAMRKYRDEILILSPEGKELVKEYYLIAPDIVRKINGNPNKNVIWEDVYQQILHIVECIGSKQYEDAKNMYTNMVKELQNEI